MENKDFKSILQNALEQEIPASQIDLWTGVKERLVAGRDTSFLQGEKMKTSRSRRMQRVVMAVLIITALLMLVLITPQGRAFAQRLFLFFSITEATSFPIATEQVFSAPLPPTPVPTYMLSLQMVENVEPTESPALLDQSCTSSESQSGYFCQIKAVEAQAGFDAKELPEDPKGLKFSKATFDPELKTIEMGFEVIGGGGYLSLSQGIGEFPLASKWGEVPAEDVKQVTVNGHYGELVLGTFMVYPNATEAVWEPGGLLRLHWSEGNRWFSLDKMGDPYPIEWMGEDEIIDLAESLIDARPTNIVPPLDPEHLKSVNDAEKLAGFDVPVPTLLPKGYGLKRAVWADGIVRLLYGSKDSQDNTLLIFMGPVTNSQSGPCFECPPGTDEEVQIGPWQGWYSRGTFETAPATAGQPTPTPVWNADARIRHLAWNTDALWISIHFYAQDDYGGELNRELLVEIAESMR